MEQQSYRFIGGMRIIEALRIGENLGTVLTEMGRNREGSRNEIFIGAIETISRNYFAMRSGGVVFSNPIKTIDRFLKMQPTTQALELARLLDGGESTLNELQDKLSALAGAVYNNRKLLTHNGKPLALV